MRFWVISILVKKIILIYQRFIPIILKNPELKKIVIEYIDGDKISFLDFFKIYKKKKYFKKKIPISKHILYLKKKYNFNNSFFIENKILYNFLKNQKSIFVSQNHGDFVHYNCVKKNNKIYIFDFEKFTQTISPFDILNWFAHPITLNIRKFLFINSNNYFLIAVNKFILNLFYFIIKILTINIILDFNIKKQDFNVYLSLYIFEKILIIEHDLAYVKKKRDKFTARQHIKVLKFIYQNIKN